MAKVKTSSLLAEIRGALGGVVFSSNGNGFYCKQQVRPVQPRTMAQMQQRGSFANQARTWSILSAAQIASWVSFAADTTNTRYDYFGDPYLPTPFNQFQSINLLRAKAGLPLTGTAPVNALPANLPQMQVYMDFQASAANSYIQRNAAFSASIAYVHVLFSWWPSIGRFTPPRPLQFLCVPAAASFPTYDIQALLVAAFGSMPADGRFYLAASPLSSEFRMGSQVVFTGRNLDTVVV